MASYRIIPRSGCTGFDVEVVGGDGVRHVILGFATEAEAEAWIDDDRIRDTLADNPLTGRGEDRP